MRAMDCECGRHLEAPDDEALVEQARRHVDEDHPEMHLSDEEIRGLVSDRVYTQGDEGEGGLDKRAPSGA
ncbi:DUF1059 domain-containing protein [Rubrobacter taiwanensis]|jgi:predicted small metal-binding protein|uniref:DUF1059 domain-containing protein n=1 Tax=Rubrobacter taiwanensis TaxID=185139 RepID=A0A4R1BSL1_9ACTN|nr:DUF1059 domain-containing protein [Rubrobacter taiwanensis]TCJ20276.1 DUF1059 domain-containing protein [Rubrobacter taiwanensis]